MIRVLCPGGYSYESKWLIKKEPRRKRKEVKANVSKSLQGNKTR